MSTRHYYVPAEGREQDACQPGLAHPIDGPMRLYGAFWTDDAYTFCLVRDEVLVMTEEEDPNPPKEYGPDAMVQHRRVNVQRPKMRIMSAPKSRS